MPPSLTATSTPLASPAGTPDASEPPASQPQLTTVEGSFDVGGHTLFISCVGDGSPTIVYLHGSIVQRGIIPHQNGRNLQGRLAPDYRFCVYDRRNLPPSEKVDAEQTPTEAIEEMHALLEAAGIEGPYVLLGASFGGLLAYLYLNNYPDEVVGMVQLDSPFPDEMSLEHLWPKDERYKAYHDDDRNNSIERISHYTAHLDAVPFIGKEPEVPLVYFASTQEPWNASGYAEYDAQVMDVLRAYVDRFSPGTFIEVDSPHFMEPEIPDEIEDALRTVIEEAGAG